LQYFIGYAYLFPGWGKNAHSCRCFYASIIAARIVRHATVCFSTNSVPALQLLMTEYRAHFLQVFNPAVHVLPLLRSNNVLVGRMKNVAKFLTNRDMDRLQHNSAAPHFTGVGPQLEDQVTDSEEMCPQFEKIITQNDDVYWGEKSLLRVLLSRTDIVGKEIFLPDNDKTPYDEHVRRRALISMLLGLKPDSQLIGNLDPIEAVAEQELY
jgi:hypothetical protein